MRQYKKYEGHNFILRVARPDNCVQFTNGQIGLIENIVLCENDDESTTYLLARVFSSVSNLYDYPLESSLLGIQVVTNLRRQLTTFEWSDIRYKCVLLPYNNNHVCFPMLHLAI